MKVGCQSCSSTDRLEQAELQLGQLPVRRRGGAERARACRAAPSASTASASLRPACADQRLAHRHARERRIEVDLAAGVGQLRRAGRLARGVAQHVLGEVHQVVVVPVRRVELHHRELGVVADRDAFVAKAPVDLEHALEAADDQPLQVQLGRDAQEHLLVERVVVGDERACAFAPPGIGCSIGVSTSMKPCSTMKRRIDESALLRATKRARARLVGDQVDVALPVLLLRVGDAVELVGQRAQALGQQAQPLDPDRQLAGARLEQRAFGADDVAEVEVLERVVGVVAERVRR